MEPEIITEAMRVAGAALLRIYSPELASPEDFVEDIYLAMVEAKARPSASGETERPSPPPVP